VLGARHVQFVASGSVLRLTNPKAIITQFAAELAAQRNIRIERG
jgi:hypothetical protein